MCHDDDCCSNYEERIRYYEHLAWKRQRELDAETIRANAMRNLVRMLLKACKAAYAMELYRARRNARLMTTIRKLTDADIDRELSWLGKELKLAIFKTESEPHMQKERRRR